MLINKNHDIITARRDKRLVSTDSDINQDHAKSVGLEWDGWDQKDLFCSDWIGEEMLTYLQGKIPKSIQLG